MARTTETKPNVTIHKKAPSRGETTAPAPIQATTPDHRWSMIQVAAYLRAEKRGFQGGDPTQDWLDAEREVDLMLAGKPRPGQTRAN